MRKGKLNFCLVSDSTRRWQNSALSLGIVLLPLSANNQQPAFLPHLQHVHISNPSTKMSSSQKGKKLTPQEEQKRREILMRMEMEALGPARIEKLKTTDYRTRKPYVPFATLRLRRLDALAKNGSLSSDEVTKLKAWRCKSFNYLLYPLP